MRTAYITDNLTLLYSGLHDSPTGVPGRRHATSRGGWAKRGKDGFFSLLLAKQQPALSEEIASIGLERLDRESYLRDCTMLFDAEHCAGVASRQCCKVLIELTPREIELIDAFLGDTGTLARCAQTLKQHATAENPPLAAAGDLWDCWLHRYLGAKLHALRGTDPLLSSPFQLPALSLQDADGAAIR